MRELVEILFPGRCVVCRRSGEVLCEPCSSTLRLLDGAVCGRCGSPEPRERSRLPVDRHAGHGGGRLIHEHCPECRERLLHFCRARSAVVYRDGAIRALAAWKEGGTSGLAKVAAALVSRVVPRPEVAILTSVPPDRDRMLWRGRDPAQALADALAREWGHASTALLGRAGGGGRQRGLDALERQTNVVGAFRASKAVPATVCLIEDVYTTGATASAAAAALRAGGACRVEVVTFARAVRRHTSALRVRDRKMPTLR